MSKLTLPEIMILTYSIVWGIESIIREFFFSEHTVVDWRQFVKEKVFSYIEPSSENIGGVARIVEVEVRIKIWEKDVNKVHKVQGQWVFGGLDRNTGRLFLIAVHDRTQDTLVGVLEQRVEKGTIFSDGWAASKGLDKKGYEHLTVNDRLTFFDPETKCHTNTVESILCHVKSKRSTHNTERKFEFYIAQYMFKKACVSKKGGSV